jgi:hypothetical protein
VYGRATGAALGTALGAGAAIEAVAVGFTATGFGAGSEGGRGGRSAEGPGGGSLRQPLDQATAPPTAAAAAKPNTLASTPDPVAGGAPASLSDDARAPRASSADRGERGRPFSLCPGERGAFGVVIPLVAIRLVAELASRRCSVEPVVSEALGPGGLSTWSLTCRSSSWRVCCPPPVLDGGSRHVFAVVHVRPRSSTFVHVFRQDRAREPRADVKRVAALLG